MSNFVISFENIFIIQKNDNNIHDHKNVFIKSENVFFSNPKSNLFNQSSPQRPRSLTWRFVTARRGHQSFLLIS